MTMQTIFGSGHTESESLASTQTAGYSPELAPDPRLCVGKLPDLTVELTTSNGSAVLASIRAISSQDLVLIAPPEFRIEVGDIVSFSVFENGVLLTAGESGVVHWITGNARVQLVALFTVGKLDSILDHRIVDDRRTEIRFPTDIPIVLRSGRTLIDARIVNYSLNGIAILCRQPLELNQNYLATGTSEDGEIRLDISTQWRTRTANGYLTGCALEPQHGVMLAQQSPAEPGSSRQRLLAQIVDEWTDDDDVQPGAESDASIPSLAYLSLGFDRISLWRTCTPMLSTFLIGISVQSTGVMKQLTLLTGLIGVMATLVFSGLARCRK